MGVSAAAEFGPYRLDMTGEYWDEIRRLNRDVDDWKYGLRIKDLVKIPSTQHGVTLEEARKLISGVNPPGRVGLRDASQWYGVQKLLGLIRSRSS
ncbi:MAG TPA: hypothetical protein VKZ59_00790 [Acidobacteriota bacterium]|nr:hypothetical protein [Acidobacteriota bacterium]